MLRSYLRDLGYTSIDIVTTGAIDWLGSAGLPAHLSIAGTELDEHFGVPVIPTIERMTAHLREELHKAVPDLLRPLLSVLEMQVGATAQRAQCPDDEATSVEPIDPPDFLVNGVIDFLARPIGSTLVASSCAAGNAGCSASARPSFHQTAFLTPSKQ